MKKKLKGLLSLWLAVVLVLGTPTVPILAEGTDHGNGSHAEWTEKNNFSGEEELDGTYYLTSDVCASDGGAVVKSGKSATICLSGNSLNLGSGGVLKVASGTLTMDDCAENQGKCNVPFNVESGGTLNLKGGNYYSDITVVSGDTVETSGTLNIGDESGRTTDVMIAEACSQGEQYICKPKIEGNFKLVKPDQNFREINGVTDRVKVFDWYLSSKGDDDNNHTITCVSISSVNDVKQNYTDLWNTANRGSGEVHLYSKWAEGHTVTFDYNDNSNRKSVVGIVSGNAIGELETPNRTNYTFKGWYKDGESTPVTKDFVPTENTILKADWELESSGGGSLPPTTPPESTTPTRPTTPDNTSDNNSNNNNNNNNNNNGTTDWNSIKSNVSNAKDGDTVTIDLSKDTTVPGDILNSIKGKDVTLVLDLGNGMSWKINGNSITADQLGDINFSVSAHSNTIPVDVINMVSGERYTIQISLAHNGPFGFEAVLAVDLDAKNAGLYANLFYFNPQTNELEFVGDDIITDKGMAEFTFTHASDYAIIIDKMSMDPKIHAKGTELKDVKTKAVYKVTKAGKTGGTVEYLKSTDKKATSISIPATITIDGITYKVTSIAANAFKSNKTVEKVTIGKNVEKIGSKAFYGCNKLKDITVKTTKLTDKTIKSKAFKGIADDAYIFVPQNKLKNYKKILVAKGVSKKDAVVSIPEKGTKLTDDTTKAVYKVTKAGKTGGTVAYIKSTDKKATSITIPSKVTIDGITYKVTSVAANAFKNNKTVEKITIGKNVTKIGEKAFYGCEKLKSIVFKTTKLTSKNVGKDVFKKIANNAIIEVPEKKLDTYKQIFEKKGLGDNAVVKK